ncbi:hypothetical protein OS493_013526 [Desmophyllum pertusum]|uniref:Uncharacterized protein n=1 Tax=Desmophyllum pertusum TaxID=174260 RepID=A0A9X0A5U6_9CNID|nr:hypothetical protein OS493_013526 [Desmophyllum pertusum]
MCGCTTTAKLKLKKEVAQPDDSVSFSCHPKTKSVAYTARAQPCNVHRYALNSSPDRPAVQVKQQVLDKLTNPEKEARTERITVTVNQQNEGDRQEVKRKVMISHKEQPPARASTQETNSSTNPGRGTPPSNEVGPIRKGQHRAKDLALIGDLEGQSVKLLVDTGTCVSTIDDQLMKKIYGPHPPIWGDPTSSAAQCPSPNSSPKSYQLPQ